MKNPLDPTLRELNDCGCCAGTAAETPRAIENRPGLDALAFRAGTQPQFLVTMLAALSADQRPALARLKTRETDDFTIALLDAWATVGDVLTFYSERIANESYLRTATERRSILELARTIGYELNPGVAASTWLNFTIESAPGAPGYALVPPGAQVQSIPGPGEKPQTYETLDPLDARKEWNTLAPRAWEFRPPSVGQTQLRLRGTTTNLKPGDALLVVGEERVNDPTSELWDFALVKSIELQPDAKAGAGATVVTLDRGLGRITQGGPVNPAQQNARVFAPRARANIFGYNAPDWRSVPTDIQTVYETAYTGTLTQPVTEWPGFTIFGPSTTGTIDLAGVHPKIMRGDWVVVTDSDDTELFGVEDVAEKSRADFLLTSQTTRLKLSGKWANLEHDRVRETAVFCEMEPLDWAAEPIHAPLWGGTIELSEKIPPLAPGRVLILAGRPARLRARAPGLQWHGEDGAVHALDPNKEFTLLAAADLSHTVEWSLLAPDGKRGRVLAAQSDFLFFPPAEDAAMLIEVATVRRSVEQNGVTVLELTEPLRHAYAPTSLAIAANIAFSTHGESVREEVLGSGDASLAHQHFTLREAPVTFTPASTPSGGKSSLEIWVNDVRWNEVPTLFARGPRERVYVARRADEGEVTVTFGDGTNGARLPTGHENVRARYRKGVGLEGGVKTGQLSLLMTRPLGVKEVINPLAASGAADPQEFKDARRNAPLTVLTLDRLVSLQDYEDFSRNFNGVAKALASWTWSVGSRGIFMTVSGPAGAAVAGGTATQQRLIEALREFGNSRLPVVVESFIPVTFRVAGTIFAAPDRVAAGVLSAVREALLAHFSFEARDFGQAVALSEVVGVMQNVPGVIAVDLDALFLTGNVSERKTYLAAAKPRNGASSASATPAELLTIDSASLQALKVATAS